ncbi:MAG TPA: hypothetical protein VEJ63_00600, partial [Planctomycetota bacterium]|nr:hypothetical protein [Planctomycetota bacterium]
TIGEWTFALAHSLLHLAFGHVKQANRGIVWNIACDCVVNEFLNRMRIGTAPEGIVRLPPGLPNDEDKLFQMWRANGQVPKGETTNGTAVDMTATGTGKANWADIFARAVRRAAKEALSSAAGEGAELTPAAQAREWFVRSFPLLGAVLQHFAVREDAKLCERLGVRIAAVNIRRKELILNPGWAMTDPEYRFVMAHMALHAGLQHVRRRRGRDALLWNAACDYCINNWLLQIGALKKSCTPPGEGVLSSAVYPNMSPEDIYDELQKNPKAARKLVTFAGESLPDILGLGEGVPRETNRQLLEALLRGYQIHAESGKGTLPIGLLEELKRLESPPPPWDVLLAKWFDEHIPPVERVRTYARPSRRQSSTPEIARPRYVWPDEEIMQRDTFALIVDASGSLDGDIQSAALGAITGYVLSRNIPRVRMLTTGAEVRDLGFVPAEELASGLQLSARPTPLIQPALAALEASRDLAPENPLLILTAMPVDKIQTERSHAWLIPDGGRLPYRQSAPVIEIDLTT